AAFGGVTVEPGSSSNNLIEGEPGAADPLFVEDPDAGDGDWSTTADNIYGDLRLTFASPAINMGVSTSGSSANTTTNDILGNARFVGPIDLGAVEYFDPYPAWIDQFYPNETDPAIVGETADPSGNGLSNILSFITDTSPLASSASPITVERDTTEISFSFPRRDDAAVRNPFVEYSTDLTNFDPALDGIDGFTILVEDDAFGTSSDGVGIDKVTVSISRSALTLLFGRLAVPSFD
ncbi:MAG: hypothetical protein AAGJ79_15660, partial [Verrucomicrobiota bacterium]